jgi:hypothetical protein
MEKSDPVNGWPQRALSLRDMMMMMIMKNNLYGSRERAPVYCVENRSGGEGEALNQ